MANNRSVTLEGAQKLFEGVAQIEHSELGFYSAQISGHLFQAKTLTSVCQQMIQHLASNQKEVK